MKKTLIFTILFLIFSCGAAFAAAPVIFYSDLTSGPNTGGQNNKGAFVTIWGKNFGATRGSSKVTVGPAVSGYEVDSYPVWTDTKISFQLGSSAATGNITVTTSEGTSNGVSFTVRSGNIYFVKTTGNDSSGDGSWNTPWKTIIKAKNTLAAGNIAYICDGVSQTALDDYNACVNLSSGGTADLPKALVAYPGATVNVGSSSVERGFYWWSGGTYWVLSQFNVTANNVAFEFYTGWRIVGNTITVPTGDGASAAIHGGYSYIKILGNELYNCGVAEPSKLYHNIYVTNDNGTALTDFEIAWNIVRNSTANRGIQIYNNSGTTTNVSVHDNICHHLRGNGINIGNGNTGTIEIYNNIIYKCAQGPDFYNGSSDYNGILIVSNNATVYLYNNLVYDCGYTGGGRDTGIFGILEFTGTIYPRDNIFYSNGQDYEPYMSVNSSSPSTGAYKNIFYGKGSAPSWDSAAVNSEPKFVNLSGYDFHLVKPDPPESNPAIDAGYDTTAIVTRDYDGVARPQGAGVDMGAYEYAVDSTPPAAVTDLGASSVTSTTVVLGWTAPGNDGNFGQAASYDIRYSTSTITDTNWTLATQAIGVPAPLPAGTVQLFTVDGLSSSTTYYFALKTQDYASPPNVSELSNIASAKTSSSGGNGGGGGGGCFIATAVYGSAMAKEERILIEFRERYLLTNKTGRKLVELYYKVSPPIAEYIKNREWARSFVRAVLKPVVWIAKKKIEK